MGLLFNMLKVVGLVLMNKNEVLFIFIVSNYRVLYEFYFIIEIGLR